MIMNVFTKSIQLYFWGIVLLFIIQPYATFAQLQKIVIVDSVDLNPIPFATVAFSDSKKVYSANDEGIFYYPISIVDTLNVSCIGYEAKKVVINKLNGLKVIKLTASNILLPNTRVESGVLQAIKTSNKGRFKGMVSAISGQQYKIGITFDSIQFGTRTLEHVYVYIPKGGNWSQPFRIGFYSLKQGIPTNESIGNGSLVVRAKKTGWNKFDLSNSVVNIPPSGCIITVEWLDFQNIDESKFDIKSKNFNLDFQQYKGQYLGLGTYKTNQISGKGYYQTIKTNNKWVSSDHLFNNFTSQKFKNELLKPLIAIDYY
jgi:hypothetical protein